MDSSTCKCHFLLRSYIGILTLRFILFAMIYINQFSLRSDRKQAKARTIEGNEGSAQPGQKDPTILGKLSNILGSGKGESEVDNEENSVGVVMFFGGILWRKGRYVSRKWKIEEEQRKQRYLGEDQTEEPLKVFVEDPQVTRTDSEEAFLEFAPGIVGESLPSDFLPEIDDSFKMYEDDEEEE